jgi:DNA excision repair protein ERCC-8
VSWSPSNEYQLFSGDGSGAVRLWDIRRSGCRALLDFNTTQRPKPITAPASTPADNSQQGGRKRARGGVQGEEEAGLGGRGKATGAAVAHEGAVTGVLATQDGLSLVSAGTDHRVRLWDAGEGFFVLVLVLRVASP